MRGPPEKQSPAPSGTDGNRAKRKANSSTSDQNYNTIVRPEANGLAEYYNLADASIGSQFDCFIQYKRKHNLDLDAANAFAGFCSVLPIIDCGNNRFDFSKGHEDEFPGFICEAIDRDGETSIDLVAWPLDRPKHVLTMFGRCGLLGVWQAINPASYYMDKTLTVHRTPLEWLQSGCTGATIVNPLFATWQILELPGRIEARNFSHGDQIRKMMQKCLVDGRIVVPSRRLAVAA